MENKAMNDALELAIMFPLAVFCPEETFEELGREESCSLLRKMCEAFPEAREQLEQSAFCKVDLQ